MFVMCATILKLLILASPSLALISAPTLPSSFSVDIEANIIQGSRLGGYTVNQREYYDYVNNRLRIDNHGGGRHSQHCGQAAQSVNGLNPDIQRNCREIEVLDFNSGYKHVVYHSDELNVNCEKHAIDLATNTEAPWDYDYTKQHLRATSSLFGLLKVDQMNGLAVYQGQSTVRGMLADVWRTPYSFAGRRRGGPMSMENLTIDWAFHATNWTNRGTHPLPWSSRAPLRITMNGTRSVAVCIHANECPSFASASSIAVVPVLHVYNLFNFVLGVPDKAIFESITKNDECSVPEACKESNNKGFGAKVAAVVVMQFVGLGIGVGIGMWLQKRAAPAGRHMELSEQE